MNRNEAIYELIKVLAAVNFKNGVLDANGNDVGEMKQRRFLKMIQDIVFKETKGVIYKLRPPSEFLADFTVKTQGQTEPNVFAVAMLETIMDAQNSALNTAKSAVPSVFHERLDELKEFNLKHAEAAEIKNKV